MRGHLFLYGPPASGKSTLGEFLASRFKLPFVDLDAAIVKAAGRTIPEIFSAEGESGFRAREQAALAAAVAGDPGVVALGGGALLAPAARRLAEEHGIVVALDAPAATLVERVAKARGTRPLASDAAAFERLLAERAGHYASFPRAASLTGFFTVEARGETTRMFTGTGLVDSAAAWLRSVACGPRVLVVTDSAPDGVPSAAPYAERVCDSLRRGGFEVACHSFAAGERSKTLRTVSDIWEACLAAGLGRGDTIVAVGGGVVGDLAGFAAAAWMRGIRWINVPTTLLAMVDSSLGGKTACDLPAGKNLVGAFHQPELVLADAEVLSTLPERELRNGLAESIKHFIIDPAAFDGVSLDASSRPDARFVAASVSVKARIVAADPLERTGLRAKLNLGHTVGHAVEMLTDFRTSHGEAVAIGTVEEARLAEREGLAAAGFGDAVAERFAAVGLPVALPEGLTFDDLLPVMARDKKNAAGRIRYALPFAFGDVRLTV